MPTGSPFAETEIDDVEHFVERDNLARRGRDPDFHYSAYRLATTAALMKNMPRFVDVCGPSAVGVLMLTFSDDIPWKEARSRLSYAWRHFFSKMFGAWICVTEFTKAGRIHFHIAVQCKEDIRADFDFAAYETYKLINESGAGGGTPLTCKKRRVLRNKIQANAALRNIWKNLDESLRKYKFGPVFDLFPLETNGIGLGKYLAKQLTRTLPRQRQSDKGAHLVSYSKKCPRAVPPGWRPPNPRFQERLNALLRVFGMESRTQLREVFDYRWANNVRQLMSVLDFEYGEVWTVLPVGTLAPIVHELIEKDGWRLQHYVGALIPNVRRTIRDQCFSPEVPPPPPDPNYNGEVWLW